eukprot:NODE_93_length_21581_cov_0.291919.p4 type:complete len:420 gc:universal NODE_93_length_21581_cov_0.291919:6460-5201(-)
MVYSMKFIICRKFQSQTLLMEHLTVLSKLQGRSYSMFLYHLMRRIDGNYNMLLQFEYFICSQVVDFELLVFYLVVFRNILLQTKANKSIKKIYLKLINYTIDLIGNDKNQDRLLFHYFTKTMDAIFKNYSCKDLRFQWNRHELYQISNPIRPENKSEKVAVDLFRFVLLEKTLKDKDKEEKLKNGFYSELEAVSWESWLNLFHQSKTLNYVLLQGSVVLTNVPNELVSVLEYASGLPMLEIYPEASNLIKLIKCSYPNIRSFGYLIVKNMLFEMEKTSLTQVELCAVDMCQWIHNLLDIWADDDMQIKTAAYQDLEEEEGEIGANVGLFYNESDYLDPCPILADFFERIDIIFVMASLDTKRQLWDLLSSWIPPFNMRKPTTHPYTLYGRKLIETVKNGITRILSLGDLWVDIKIQHLQ